MKRNLILGLLLSLLTLPASAQVSAVGFQLGVSQSAEDGVDFDFNGDLKELFYSIETDEATTVKLKVGRIDTNEGSPVLVTDGKVEYLALVGEYRFYEVFGSTSIFAGPAGYRQKFGDFDETDFGLTGGVNGLFPVTRKFGVIAEVAYHWANFEESRTFVTASAGVRFAF